MLLRPLTARVTASLIWRFVTTQEAFAIDRGLVLTLYSAVDEIGQGQPLCYLIRCRGQTRIRPLIHACSRRFAYPQIPFTQQPNLFCRIAFGDHAIDEVPMMFLLIVVGCLGIEKKSPAASPRCWRTSFSRLLHAVFHNWSKSGFCRRCWLWRAAQS